MAIIQQAKADIKTAIENKGITIPSGTTIDKYAAYIDSLNLTIPICVGGNISLNFLNTVEFPNHYTTCLDNAGNTLQCHIISEYGGMSYPFTVINIKKSATGFKFVRDPNQGYTNNDWWFTPILKIINSDGTTVEYELSFYGNGSKLNTKTTHYSNITDFYVEATDVDFSNALFADIYIKDAVCDD